MMEMKGMKKKGRGRRRGTAMRMKQIVIVALILVAFVAPASAAELTVDPPSATVGDEVTIEGTGFTANETVTLKTTATCGKPAISGICECCINNFKIPDENVSFWLSVSPVKNNVTIHVKKYLIWWTIDHDMLGFHFTYNPATSTSTVSRMKPIPAGTYTIDVMGDAVDGAENCSMTTTVEKELKVEADGNFSETFDTTGIPISNLTINATDESGVSDEATLGLFLLGDASKSGQVNVYDCVCIARYALDLSGYDDTTVCWKAADVAPPRGNSNNVTLADARCLARYLVGLESSIPCS